MNCLLFLMDVAPDPVSLGVGAVILLLVIVMVLAVIFAGGLVLFLIWRKRRKTKGAEESQPAERLTA
jgi:flagellar basal body-associated protein FliL